MVFVLSAKKRTTTKKTPAKSTSRSKSTSQTKAGAAKRPVRREVWSLICFFLAIFAFLGFFNIKGLFIEFFAGVLKGLLGFGYYSMAVMLLCASVILLFHRGRPVRMRVWFCIALSAVFSSILHLFISDATYDAGFFGIVKALYQEGNALKSGGLIGGFVAIALKYIFSKIGAAILLIGGALFIFFVAFNISLIAIYDAVIALFTRERPEYELEEPQRPAEPLRSEKAVTAQRRRVTASMIDIPLDDDTVAGKSAQPKKEHRGLFRKRPPHIRTPDEVLIGTVADQNTADTYDTPAATAEPTSELVDRVLSGQDISDAYAEEEVASTTSQATENVTVQGSEPAKNDPAADEEIKRQVREEIESNVSISGGETYTYPPFSLLEEGTKENTRGVNAELKLNATRLTDTIKSFGIEARLINITRGPSVTRFELEMDRGVKLNKLTGLADDIALSLGATGVRIAPIPDKVAVVGIEVPNKSVSIVHLREVLESKEFVSSESKVSFAVGKDIGGDRIVGDISKLPHLLIAGTTGSGKSVCMNSLIVSLLYKSTPEEVRLIMIDPKMIELNIYNGIPHLLIPVVTDPRKASGALNWAVTEMMRRYKLFSENNVRDIDQYNAVVTAEDSAEKLPRIVIVIDELADLMLVAAKEVEEAVCRVAQMARAAGMHLIIATQRPSADVITGIMKANIPSRIAFAVASQLESRIILDTTGAEKLVGKGDMLYYPLGEGKPMRVQGCLISSREVERVVEFVKKSGDVDYSDEVLEHIEKNVTEGKDSSSAGDQASELDEVFNEAVEVILDSGQASVSMLQRRLRLGYARAARLVDQMESRGIVGPFEGAKPRSLLITKDQWEEMKLQNTDYQ
jgi:S-DNA-T family DNA segregation ATPase FtsK/SpoIIIE